MSRLTRFLVPVAKAPDDRGRAVELVDLREALRSPLMRHAPTAEVVRSATAMVTHQAGAVSGLFGLPILLVSAALFGPGWGWGRWAACIALSVATVPVVRFIQVVLVRRGAHALTARFRSHALCAGCMYDLAGLPVEHDGCVVCPECGAAWRAAAFQRRDPIELRAAPAESVAARLRRSARLRASDGWEHDALGRRVTIDTAWAARLARTEPDPGRRARLERVAARIDWARARKRRERLWLVGLAVVALLGAAGIASTNATAGALVFGAVFLVTMPVLVIGYVGAVAVSIAGGKRQGFAAVMALTERLCPVCFHGLEAAPPDDNGVVRCPGCASAWRFPLGTPAPWNLTRGCPNCRDNLAGLAPNADGRVRCPECGSQWPAPRAGKGPPRGGGTPHV